MCQGRSKKVGLPPVNMTSCVVCTNPLTLFLEDEDGDEMSGQPGASSSSASYVDDDVQLLCGCHFHWQCLLDTTYELTSCPSCKANTTSADSNGNQKLLCNLKNEGGLQEGLDILPILTEESYLRAYPGERKCRAFLEFCAEGDVPAIVDMLNDDDDDSDGDEEEMATSSSTLHHKDILRYQDQLGSMSSGLHVAIENRRTEVAWFLLILASNVSYSAFPDEVKTAANVLGVVREDQTGKVDIRALKDAEGMTAYERARAMGGVWETLVKEGAFNWEPILQAP